MILVPVLAFLSITLLILAVGFSILRGRSRTVKKLMVNKLASSLATGRAGAEDLVLLKDRSLSRIDPLQKILIRLRVGTRLGRLIEQADIKMKPGTVFLLISVCALAGFLLGHVMHWGFLAAIIAGAFCGSLPILVIKRRRTRRMRKFEAQFPDAIDLLARAIRAGHALNTGIKMVADEMPEPVSKEFKRVFEEQNFGLNMKTALLNLMDRIDLLDLRLFVVAVLIQRQSGGNLAELLGTIAHTIRERFRVFRQLKVHTAQAKLTGIILMCLPPVMAGITIFLNYEYMKIIFQTSAGLHLLIAAAVLQIVGLFWIRKIVNIEV